MERYERETDIIDLIETICRKWRIILIFMLIGLFAGLGIAFFKSYNLKKQSTKESIVMTAEQHLAEVEKKLSDRGDYSELKQVADNNVVNYYYKMKQYDLQADYIRKSIYYNIDEQNVAQAKLTYYIDNKYVSSYSVVDSYYNIENIIQYYIDSMQSYELYDNIISKVYPESEYKYIEELIDIGTSSGSNIYINIVADSLENAQKISDIIQSEMITVTKKAENIYGDVECELQINQYSVSSDIVMVQNHSDSLQKLNDISMKIDAINKSMTGAQLEYFQAKLGMYEAEISEEPSYSLMYYFPKKLVVLAVILGALVPIGFVCCAYFMSGSMKTSHDLVDITESILLGVIAEKKISRNPIDKLLDKIFINKAFDSNYETNCEVVANYIIELMKKYEVSSLCMIGSVEYAEDKMVVNLVERLVKKNLDIKIADNFLKNTEGMAIVNNSDVIVICEKANQSMCDNIKQEANLLRLDGKKILGCLVV